MDQLEEDEHETKHGNGQTNGQGPHTNNSKGKINRYDFVSPSVFVSSSFVFLNRQPSSKWNKDYKSAVLLTAV